MAERRKIDNVGFHSQESPSPLTPYTALPTHTTRNSLTNTLTHKYTTHSLMLFRTKFNFIVFDIIRNFNK